MLHAIDIFVIYKSVLIVHTHSPLSVSFKRIFTTLFLSDITADIIMPVTTSTESSGPESPSSSFVKEKSAVFTMNYLDSDYTSASFSYFGGETEDRLATPLFMSSQAEFNIPSLVEDEELVSHIFPPAYSSSFAENSYFNTPTERSLQSTSHKVDPFVESTSAIFGFDYSDADQFFHIENEPQSPVSLSSDVTDWKSEDGSFSPIKSSVSSSQDSDFLPAIKASGVISRSKQARKLTEQHGVRSYFNVDSEFPWECYVKDDERRAKIALWKQKKLAILKVGYQPKGYAVRKRVADGRERINGRFVSKAEQDRIRGASTA